MELVADMGARFRLRELLEKADMSQSELARQSGVSFVTVNRMVANKTASVSLKTLDALSAALGVEPGDLLEREPKRRRIKPA
jgi:DNA-binding Xre family transcriptional regulator